MRIRQMIFVLGAVLMSTAAATPDPIIHQKGRAFSASALTLAPGESLVFLNDDTVPHNVMSTSDGNSFDLGAQMPGTATSLRFTQTGIVMVICAIHPRMQMTITVAK